MAFDTPFDPAPFLPGDEPEEDENDEIDYGYSSGEEDDEESEEWD